MASEDLTFPRPQPSIIISITFFDIVAQNYDLLRSLPDFRHVCE